MFKKTIEYTDFDGNQRTEDFYFHLSKPEILELDASEEGGIEKAIKKIISTQDTNKIIDIFKKIINMSIGEKSPDGRRFRKNQEVKDSFLETEAYSILFMELATNTASAQQFINGIIPQDIEANKTNNIVALPGSTPVDGVQTPTK